MFGKRFVDAIQTGVDMISVDTVRESMGGIVTTLTLLNVESGQATSKRLDGNFEENGRKITDVIRLVMPVQVFFDTVGFGLVVKNSIMKELSKFNDIEVTSSFVIRNKN